MRLLHQISLFFQQGRSDKVYEADLCELEEGQYVVNFRYGRRGKNLKEGTKTKSPVELSKAEAIFDKLVSEKESKGYLQANDYKADDYGGEAPAETAQEATQAAPVQEAEPVVQEAPPQAEPTTDEPQEVHPGRGASSREEAILQWLQFYVDCEDLSAYKTSWSLSGVVRRAGELQLEKAGPLLAKLAKQDKPVAFDLAWSLGQIGGKEAINALKDLESAHSLQSAVGRMVYESENRWASGRSRKGLENRLIKKLPTSLKKALKTEDTEAIQAGVLDVFDSNPESLYALYILEQPSARAAFKALITTCPLTTESTQILRELLQASQDRQDIEIFAELLIRFDSETALPYSPKGRSLFKQALWKTFSGWAQQESSTFVTFASAVLGKLSQTPSEDAISARLLSSADSFPAAWAQATPTTLLQLSQDAQLDEVQALAKGILDNRAFFTQEAESVDLETLEYLLNADSTEYQELGQKWAKERLGEPEVFALFGSQVSAEMVSFWSTWAGKKVSELAHLIEANGESWSKNHAFLFALLTHKTDGVRKAGESLLDGAKQNAQERRLFTQRFVRMLSEQTGGSKSIIASLIGKLWSDYAYELSNISLEQVQRLLEHKQAEKQRFGAYLVMGHPAESISQDLLQALCSATDTVARGVGLRLLQECNDEQLPGHQELLFKLCQSPPEGSGSNIRALLQRLFKLGKANKQDYSANLVAYLTT